MEYRSIGSLEVSVAGLGCWNFGRYLDEAESASVVLAAFDAGITFFDTSDRYGKGMSEVFLGKALGNHREEVVIGSKFGAGLGAGHRAPDGFRSNRGGGSARYIVECVEGSLTRLGTDRIDLLQMHEPDLETPIGETLTALTRLIQDGKVVEVGCSNFTAPMLDDAVNAAQSGGIHGFVSVQNQYSLFHRQPEEDGVLDACGRHGIRFIPYFPLASGVLTGKYLASEEAGPGTRMKRLLEEGRQEKASRFLNKRTLGTLGRLAGFAQEHGHTLTELALSWLAAAPTVAAIIPGATSAAQARENAIACSGWKLTPEDLAAIEAIAPRSSRTVPAMPGA